MTNSFISIVMATYNGEPFIKEQIDSILKQTYQNFELLICDDCSTDSTLTILNEYTKLDSRIKVYNNSFNIGFKKNFENLLKQSKGEYIALSDQDDIWTPNHLEILLSKIQQYSLVCSNSILIDENGKSLGFTMKDVFHNHFMKYEKKEIQIHLLHYNFVQGATCLISRTLLEKSLPIPENITFHDYWFAINAAFSKGIYYFNEPLLMYRQHNNNVTLNNKWNLFDKIFDAPHKNRLNWEKQIELLQIFLDKKNVTMDEAEIIQNTIDYYQKLRSKKTVKCIKYFLTYYESIYFDKNIFIKLLRFIKLFILKV